MIDPWFPRLSAWSTLPGKHVCDRLDPAVRVPGEARQIVLRALIPEIIQEQERVDVLGVAEAEGTVQPDACAFDRSAGLALSLDGTNGHGTSAMQASARFQRLVVHDPGANRFGLGRAVPAEELSSSTRRRGSERMRREFESPATT